MINSIMLLVLKVTMITVVLTVIAVDLIPAMFSNNKFGFESNEKNMRSNLCEGFAQIAVAVVRKMLTSNCSHI